MIDSFTLKTPVTNEDYENYFHFRWRLLRAPWGEPEGSERDDIEDQCSHIMMLCTEGLTDLENVIGVGRLQINAKNQSQIRYMAIDEKHRRKGLGNQIIKHLENKSLELDCSTVTLHARENAVDFYLHLGYQVEKPSYLLFDEIQHYQMSKTL